MPALPITFCHYTLHIKAPTGLFHTDHR